MPTAQQGAHPGQLLQPGLSGVAAFIGEHWGWRGLEKKAWETQGVDLGVLAG